MKFLLYGLGKFIFQLSIVIFIMGYCFGFWFKDKRQAKRKLKSARAKVPVAQLNEKNKGVQWV